MNADRPDLPCPWCRGLVRHVVGCPSPNVDDPRWDDRKRAHAAAVAYGSSDYGIQLMRLLEEPRVYRDALALLGKT